MELPLHNGFEVRLHGLAGHLHDVGQGDLGADGDVVDLRAVHHDLVVLHLAGFLGRHQLEAVHAGAVHLHLHIAPADDLALKRGGEGHGDVDIGDLQLDVPGLQGGGVPLGSVQLLDQALGHVEHILRLVGDDGEAQADGACAVGHDLIGQGLVGIHEGADALHGVLIQRLGVAGGDVAEDQRRPQRHGNHMDHRLHLVAQGHHPDILAQLHARLMAVADGFAGQGDQDALRLVGLGQRHSLRRVLRAAEDDGNAGDIAGDQGHAQVPHEGVGQVAALRLRVGGRPVEVLQRLQELRAQGGGNAGFERVVHPVDMGQLGLQGAQGGLHLTQVGNFFAGDGVIAGQGVGGVGEGHGLALAIGGDGLLNRSGGAGVIIVAAAENSVKKCHGISS